jgi:haloalkane dehalogenase
MPNADTASEPNLQPLPLNASTPTGTEVRDSFFGPPHRFLDVGHSRLAYRRFGRGPDVFFVHGWPLHSATFRAVVPVLAKAFTCHLIDLPGAGQTETGPDASIDFVSHARTLQAAVDVLELRSYSIVSHDSGGVSTRLLAADDPRVTALVVSGSEIPGHRPRLVKLYARTARLPGGEALLWGLLRLRAIQRSFLGFGGAFYDLRTMEGDFRELFIEPLLRSRRVAHQQAELLRHVDFGIIDALADTHARIRAPVLLIWGAGDPYFPAAKAGQMAHQFAGGAEFVAVPDAKLYVHEERPAEFARRAHSFLLAHARPAAGEARA